MGFEVNHDAARGMVDVRYFDRVKVADRGAAMDRTLKILAATNARRIAIDFNDAVTGSDLFQDTNAFATRVSTNAVLRHCRIAFIGAQSNRFNVVVETLAEGRGYGFRRFFERQPALDWLMQFAPGEPRQSAE